MNDDQRREPRSACHLPATLRRGKRLLEVVTEDVSFGGLFLRVDAPPAVMQLVEIQMALPPLGRHVRLHGMVVHVLLPGHGAERASGIGIELRGLSGDGRATWGAFVRYVQSEPSAADRDKRAYARGRVDRNGPSLSVREEEVSEDTVDGWEDEESTHVKRLPTLEGPIVPSRERTILGVAVSQSTESPAAPVVVPPPPRARTVLGVGMQGTFAGGRAQPKETSGQEPPPDAWNLPKAEKRLLRELPLGGSEAAARFERAERNREPPPPPDPSVTVDLSDLMVRSDPSLVPAGVPRRHTAAWWVLWGGVAAVAAVGYMRREHLRPLLVMKWDQAIEWVITRR
jgi:PilZ domain-containing protein